MACLVSWLDGPSPWGISPATGGPASLAARASPGGAAPPRRSEAVAEPDPTRRGPRGEERAGGVPRGEDQAFPETRPRFRSPAARGARGEEPLRGHLSAEEAECREGCP